MDKLSSDDLAHFRAACKAKAASDAIWNHTLSVLVPKYSLQQSDSISDDDGLITRAQQPTPPQPVLADESF